MNSDLQMQNYGWSWLKKFWAGESFYYFSTPDKMFEIVGVDELTSFDSIQEALGHLDHSSFAFFETPFYSKKLKIIVPKKLFVRKGDTAYTLEQSPNTQKQIFIPLAEYKNMPTLEFDLIRQHDTPDREDWSTYFEKAQQAFRHTDIKKLVLARKTVFTTALEPDPIEFARSFFYNSKNTYNIARYLNGELFFSKTPEKLFSYESGVFKTDAIAGTQALNEKSDENFDLLTSNKNNNEHNFVADSICKTLSAFSENILVKDKDILELSNLRHIRTSIEAHDIKPENLEDILKSLHPTPAVSGAPQERSLAWLSDHEPMDRAQYAGLIGLIGGGLSNPICEAAVTIRSGELSDTHVRVYTGVGIVSESEAQLEWDELELKLEQILSGLKTLVPTSHETQL